MGMERNASPSGKRIVYRKFVMARVGQNNNKFWNVSLYDSNDVEIHFGRIGKTETQGVHFSAGESFVDKKTREKIKKGYKEIDTIDTVDNGNNENGNRVVVKGQLRDVAVKQIDHSCKETAALIKWLADINVHNIMSATRGAITFNNSSGLFETPLGIVKPDSIVTARDCLIVLADYINKFQTQGWPDKHKLPHDFINNLEEYLTLIPTNVGMKLEPSIFLPDLQAIQGQNQILDALDASYQQATNMPQPQKKTKKTAVAKVFDVKLQKSDDKRDIDRIIKLFSKSINKGHVSRYFKVKIVYTVDIAAMRSSFDDKGVKIGNIKPLWHGTKASNLLSILKGGFIIPPSSSSHVTGRMYGDGLYFSDQSTKALNYATTFWGGRDEGRYFMFLVRVAMGKAYTPTSGWGYSGYPRKGYDSTFAKAGASGVSNNEMIVYKTCQVNPIYLVEFRQ